MPTTSLRLKVVFFTSSCHRPFVTAYSVVSNHRSNGDARSPHQRGVSMESIAVPSICSLVMLLAGPVLLCTPCTFAASPAQSNTVAIQSDPQAVAYISKAIVALGGTAAWQAVGAGTAEASISSPGVPTQNVQWADDWSLGYVRSRRNSTKVGDQTAMITSKNDRTRRLANGTTQTLPRENDIVVLAIGYPAAALMATRGRPDCSFRLGAVSPANPSDPGSTSDEQTVTSECIDPLMPKGRATLTWVFSKASGLPQQVRIPIHALLQNTILYETVRFTTFANTQGLLTPSKLTIVRPSGIADSLTIDNLTLTSAIPDSTFQVSR
jgi:hypothetical protein